MSALATALSTAMTTSTTDLVLLDRASGTWTRHPWQEVHTRAENIAEHIVAGPAGAVGLVGEPTVEFVAAIQGAWLAGRALSILPGPIRGADGHQWAGATSERFTGIGVSQVFSLDSHLKLLQDNDSGLAIHDVTAVGHSRRSSTFDPRPADAGTPAILQGTAGSTGTPRTAMLSPEAVVNNVVGLARHASVDATVDVGCSWLPLYHDMGLSFLLNSALTASELWLAPTAAFAASPFRWLTWLSESRASITAAPNFAYSVLGKYARRVSDIDLAQDALRHQRWRAGRLCRFRTVLDRDEPFRARSAVRRTVVRPGRVDVCRHLPAPGNRPALRRDRRSGDRFHDAARRARRSHPRHGVADRADRAVPRRPRPAALTSARSRSAGRR